MTAQAFCGAELHVTAIGGVDGFPSATTVTRDTTQKRSGLASWKVDSGAGNAVGSISPPGFWTVDTSPLYYSVWVRLPANPSTAAIIFIPDTLGLTAPAARLNTDGTVSKCRSAVMSSVLWLP